MGIGRVVSEQVLFDILLFLPVISLLRFKTICKFWCSIIESSTFVTQHLYHNNEKNNLIVNSYYEDQLFMLSGRKYGLCSASNFEGIHQMGFFSIVNSCNGIACLAHHFHQQYFCLSLWNPATKQIRELPESSYMCCNIVDTVQCRAFALGFDIKTNDYKIISISLDWRYMLYESLVQVYNMRNDSWRTIYKGKGFPIMWINLKADVACKNELCLWSAEPPTIYEGKYSNVILYFDLTDEVYGTISLPDNCSSTNHSPAFLSDKIAYIKWKRETISGWYCEIWMMNEFGMKESWNKVYKIEESISPGEGLSRRGKLLNNGEFILTDIDGELHLYDLVTGEETVLLSGMEYVPDAISCNESLVSVKSTNTTS